MAGKGCVGGFLLWYEVSFLTRICVEGSSGSSFSLLLADAIGLIKDDLIRN